MKADINLETINKVIDTYGAETELIVCMEECAELQQAISKMLRGIGNRHNIVEEVADVIICIEMIKSIYGLSDTSIQQMIEAKQDRTRRRIDEQINK